MKGYQTATDLNYAFILRMLINGDEQGVLVRSLLRSDTEPYPLLEISKGPYGLTSDGLHGYSLEGEKVTIRISDNSIHNIEMKRGDGEWTAPEMSSVILLLPCSTCSNIGIGRNIPHDVQRQNGQKTCICSCGQWWWCYNDHFDLWTRVDDKATWENIQGGCRHPVSIGMPAKNLPPGGDYI